jgi:DNA-binding PucR family transcriptional regulator
MTTHLAGLTARMTTATLAEMDRQHDWFAAMRPEHRSWITLVARAGIDQFVTWFADLADDPPSPAVFFNAAPRQATRRISLNQTVQLVKTTVSVVAQELQTLPPDESQVLGLAIVYFSRDVAFAAAELYAQAAETRGDWDTRLEALVVDSIIRDQIDDDTLSGAAALGWRAQGPVRAAVGGQPSDLVTALDRIRLQALRAGLDLLASPQDNRLILILGGAELTDQAAGLALISQWADHFSSAPLVVGPPVSDLTEASASLRPALSGQRAAAAWPEAPRPVAATDLLIERALAGDANAGEALVAQVFRPLALAGPDLLATVTAYLDQGGSIQATARALFVHANTVRYRLARVSQLAGLDPTQPREAFGLGLAIRLGRLRNI